MTQGERTYVYGPSTRSLSNVPLHQVALRRVQKYSAYAPSAARWGLVAGLGLLFMCSTTPRGVYAYITK
jgi:hypothetical protein